MVVSLHELVGVSKVNPAQAARECIHALHALPVDDTARDDFRCAAQTFALLAIADALYTNESGRSLAEVVAIAGDVAL